MPVRNKHTHLGHLHLPLAAILVALCSTGLAQENMVRFDFETGDLQGWRVIEGGFDKFVCDRAVFHNTGKPYNKQGKYFLSTLEQKDNRPSDRFIGVAQSPVFVLEGPKISLLVGGGRHRDTYVALCTLDGSEAIQARGANTETMQRINWEVPELVGRPVFVRIVDGSTAGWGHVTFDDFTAQGRIDPEATAANFAHKGSVLEEVRLAGLPSPGNPNTLRLAIEDLISTFGDRYAKGREYLDALSQISAQLQEASPVRVRQVMHQFRELQRKALLDNPLVRDWPILFVVRKQYRPDHHNTATMFQVGEINQGSFRGGGALKALDVATGEARSLVNAPKGLARDPEVDFSGDRVIFSMRREPGDDYHIYEVGADGSNLRQLTFAPRVSDIDPLYLPDGSIAFSSTREPKYCMCNRHIMANLFRMGPDGEDIHQIGKSTLMEGQGTLTRDGRILYNRWEYVDRNFGDAQGLWTVNPDGTNHAIYWGNNTTSPGAVLDARQIPGSEQAVCTFGSCHDRPWGALAIIDRNRAIDGRGGVVRTWPADAIEKVDRNGFDSYVPQFPKYEDPYPLSDLETGAGAGKYFLCSRMTGTGDQMGIYLLDVFGNELLVHTEGPGCFDPMPLCPRVRPEPVPARRNFENADGFLYVADVYAGTHMKGVKRGAVKYLRVVESPEKRQWTSPGWSGQGTEAPAMSWHDFNNKRILGTAPVAEDGSAYFAVPADRFVYFQLLDAQGMMIQSMRSGTMVQSGETTGCLGCHEDRHSAPPVSGGYLQAPQGEPARLRGWHGAPRLFSYMDEVQPVFDRNCTGCHDYGKPAGRKLLLAGDRDLVFNTSYNELWRKKYVRVVGAGPAEIQQAYSWGSHASPLVQKLRSGHPRADIDPEDLDRIITWIDINAPYYPTYASAYPGNLAGRSPLDNGRLQRLSDLTGVALLTQAGIRGNLGPQITFERPNFSPCLNAIEDQTSKDYIEACAIIAGGLDALKARPRADGAAFVPCDVDQAREERYTLRRREELRNREALREGRQVCETPGQ